MKMKPAIRSPGPQKARANAFRISAPAGHPAGDIAKRMRREQQVHARRAARQFLLPDRDLVVLDRRRDEHDELARVVRELVFLLVMGDRSRTDRARPAPRAAERAEARRAGRRRRSRTATDESLPWSGVRAAIVRMRSSSARRRPGPDELARLGRAAGLEEREDR